ncbi:hypothetical protein MAR_021725 [Mya arenaria]|uniref:Transposase n=1 Tax=Mya arenaria TaxID=6604 RepID=A0ABY7EGS2_MYAAR|nr:hypothetical protein MAR_021725 [Mya arenaria]
MQLGMRKVCASWIPRVRTFEQKQQRIADSNTFLENKYRSRGKRFLESIITADEVWTSSEEAYRQFYLHHDNTPIHTYVDSKTTLAGLLDINTIQHPQFSPDLAPCDYWLFRIIRNVLRG